MVTAPSASRGRCARSLPMHRVAVGASRDMLPDMIEGWVLWLVVVALAIGAAAVGLLLIRLPHAESDVGAAERREEAAWISSTIERHGGVAPSSLVEEVLDLHQAYLRDARRPLESGAATSGSGQPTPPVPSAPPGSGQAPAPVPGYASSAPVPGQAGTAPPPGPVPGQAGTAPPPGPVPPPARPAPGVTDLRTPGVVDPRTGDAIGSTPPPPAGGAVGGSSEASTGRQAPS